MGGLGGACGCPARLAPWILDPHPLPFALFAAQLSTQSRVALFSLVETMVLIAVTVLQIWYVRRMVNNSQAHLPGLR